MIDFSHTFNFMQNDMVALLINMSFVLMKSDLGLFTFFNHNNNETLGLFSIMISHYVLRSKINKTVSPWSKCLWVDITNFICPAVFVELFLIVQFSIYNHFRVTNHMSISTSNCFFKWGSILNNINFDIWVEFLKLRESSIGSAFLSNMLFLEVEVSSKIINFCDFWIK